MFVILQWKQWLMWRHMIIKWHQNKHCFLTYPCIWGREIPVIFLSAAKSIPYRCPCGINRIHHWCSMGTGKYQPSGPTFQWETRQASGERWIRGLVFSCLHWKSKINSFSYMPPRKQCPLLSFLKRQCRDKMAKNKKNCYQYSFYFN